MGERRRRPLNTGAAFRGNHVLARFDRWLRRHPWPAAGLVVALLFTVDLLSAGPRIALATTTIVIWVAGFLAFGALFSWFEKRRDSA